ncbi:MAG: MucBP domain-containing protein [Erysipelotrichales bacterium]
MKKIITISFSFIMCFILLASNVNAQDKIPMDDFVPDKNLQIKIFDSLVDNGAVTNIEEVTKEVVEEKLEEVTIDDSISNLEGLQYAKELYNIGIGKFYTKSLQDISFEPIKDLNGPDGEDGITLEVSEEHTILLKDGDLEAFVNYVKQYQNLKFESEILLVGKVFQVDETNYKKFEIKLSDVYKPYKNKKNIDFSDIDTSTVFIIDDEDGESYYLYYDVSFDSVNEVFTFTFNEEDSTDDDDNPIPFSIISKNTKTPLFLSDPIHFVDEEFLKEIDGPDFKNIGIEEFDFSFAMQTPKDVEQGKVLVNHLDKDNNVVGSQEELSGAIGSDYVSHPKNIENYILDVTPDNATGKFSANDIIVNYIYKKKESKVIVNYLDQVGNKKLSEPTTLNGFVGDNYVSAPINIDNYELVGTPTNATGKYVDSDTIVNYLYKKLKSNVVVKYVDESNGPLSDETKLSGNIGTDYNTTPKVIDGYDLKTTPTNANGVYAQEDIEVVYVYKVKPAKVYSTVTTKFVDEDNHTVADDVVSTGEVDSDYVTQAKTIDNYDLIKTPENANGKYSTTNIDVVYVYKKKAPVVSKVIVKYVDTDNKKIADDTSIEGVVGSEYTTNARLINGYELVKTPTNHKGIITIDPITVTYIYKKKAVVEYGQVVIKYVDTKNNELIKKDIIKGKVGQEYKTHSRTIKGYTLKETKGNTKGKFTNNTIEVTYVYTKNKDKDKDKNKKKIVKTGSETILIASILGIVGISGLALQRKYR